MEAPVGLQACNQAPGAGQALCNTSLWLCAHSRREAVPPGGAPQAGVPLWGITESAFLPLECLSHGLEHVGMSLCSPEHTHGCDCPKGKDPDCTAVLIIWC